MRATAELLVTGAAEAAIRDDPDDKEARTLERLHRVLEWVGCRLERVAVSVRREHRFIPLSRALQRCRSLREIKLVDVPLGSPAGAAELAYLCTDIVSLRRLDVSGLDLCQDAHANSSNAVKALGVTYLAKGLAQSASLAELSVRNCRLHAAGARILADGIERNTGSLRALDAAHNPFGFEGVSSLCRAVARSKLESLDMSGNRFTDAEVGVACTLLATSHRLRAVKLDASGTGDAGAASVALLVRTSPALHTLSVLGLALSRTAADALGEALVANANRLRRLTLHDVQFAPDAVPGLSHGVGRSALEVLDLTDAKGLNNGKAVDKLVSGVRRCVSLRSFSLAGCNAGDRAANAIAAAASAPNAALRDVALSGLTDVGLAELLPAMRRLVVARFRGAFSDAALVALAHVVSQPECSVQRLELLCPTMVLSHVVQRALVEAAWRSSALVDFNVVSAYQIDPALTNALARPLSAKAAQKAVMWLAAGASSSSVPRLGAASSVRVLGGFRRHYASFEASLAEDDGVDGSSSSSHAAAAKAQTQALLRRVAQFLLPPVS